MSPKQITLKASLQLKASRGVSARAALNIPGPTGLPILSNVKDISYAIKKDFKDSTEV
jgi:hypothetical protein